MYYLIRNRNTNELAIWCFTWKTKQLRLVRSFTQKTQEKTLVRRISDSDKILAKAKHYKDLYFDAAMEELTPMPKTMPKTFTMTTPGVYKFRTL